jgi:hypothetical protein
VLAGDSGVVSQFALTVLLDRLGAWLPSDCTLPALLAPYTVAAVVKGTWQRRADSCLVPLRL